MIPTLSICIPTLNRPELLLQTLNSIFNEHSLHCKLEICISNNASSADYRVVETLLDGKAAHWNIKYVRQSDRLPLDENHHYVKSLATSDYIFFLGDDDFFLRDELPILLEFITKTKPNLAIFNGFKVNEDNHYLGTLFTLPPRVYESIDIAFSELWDKGSFGAILVRRELLTDADFQQLYGTDHAYGCYWTSLFRIHERGESLKITVPNFPCVAVRCAKKNYNHLDVYFKSIPYEFEIRRKIVKIESLRRVIDIKAASFEKFQSSIRFLCYLRSTGNDLDVIRMLNQPFYFKHKRSIQFSQYFGISAAYKVLSYLYRTVVNKVLRFNNEINHSATDYKLSAILDHSSLRE